jgi:predicted enzyme related to lactoylglutathione lyase
MTTATRRGTRRGLALGVALLLGGLAITCGGGSPTAPTSTGGAAGACAYVPGAPCFGRLNYVEYVPGDLPLVISVPHGGALAPSTIPDRMGTTATDTNTIELGRAIAQAFLTRTGRRPHLVICHLKRTKLDANREVGEAAEGNPNATQAWQEYHGFIDAATHAVATGGSGLYIDLHGHGHAPQRLELGYLLSAATLDLTDEQLDAGGYAWASSLHLAMGRTPQTFAQLLRGADSLGGLLLGAGVPSVPSPAVPSPGADPYFTGGYSTERHTNTIPGLQIESKLRSRPMHHGRTLTGAADRATCRELDTSIRFYRDALGFTVDMTFENEGKPAGAVISAGAIRIVLNQDDGKLGWGRIKGQGCYLQINVATAGDVDAAAARVKAAGGTLIDEPADRPWGVRMFQFRDPDGFKFGVSTPLSK